MRKQSVTNTTEHFKKSYKKQVITSWQIECKKKTYQSFRVVFVDDSDKAFHTQRASIRTITYLVALWAQFTRAQSRCALENWTLET